VLHGLCLRKYVGVLRRAGSRVRDESEGRVELAARSGYLLHMATGSASDTLLLIFDLDGTLYRTESSFVQTMRRIYVDRGLPHPGDAAILAMVGETFDTFLDWLIAQGFDGGRELLQEEIARLEMAAIREHGELYAGVPETLRELQRRGFLLALCTNGDRRYVDAVLSRGCITEHFSALSTLERGGRTKPERVGDLIRKFRQPQAVVVGDRTHDLEAARANGCRMVGAVYGYARSGELAAADHTIATFPQLLEVVDRLAG
jgi:HAD superfamily hydrolase (TIGR01549 family)